jgi:DNA-binding response OmpR family regulator
MDSTCNLLLLAHDSPAIAKLARELTLDGYHVHTVIPRRLAAQTLLGETRLVLLAAPDQEQGLCLLRALRAGQLAPKLSADTPALWICATGDPSELLRAFDSGGDDVLRRPWTYDELLARIRALLTRRRPQGASTLRCGALEIDMSARRASFAGASVALRRLEYELLADLAQRPGRVCSK